MNAPKQRFFDAGDHLLDLLGGSAQQVGGEPSPAKPAGKRGRRGAREVAVVPVRPVDAVLVVCPECRGCARIVLQRPEVNHYFAPRRLVCACGRTQAWAGREVGLGGPVDPYFHLPLWLQGNFRGHVLWAYHLRHLLLIEQYVGASLREHRAQGASGWQNRSLLNRLPKWVKSGKNRDGVLRVIARLKQSVAG